ncbi:alkene reductase [Phanerochaete sordida]|uniref:Alkene reductase n=1 Tax=Phanerochaete sordida TaxID=48140 RepID=A0A9P3LBZ9_9APHY|nr:alkene reductase [Phanerochaete sordida]
MKTMSTTSQMPKLSEPLTLGDLTVRNRNVMASLTRNRSVPTTVPNDANLEYYTQRAQGGCGLILTEGTLIAPQGTEWPNAPGIWSEEQAHAWKRITDSVHEAGALIFCQLWHVGRVAHTDMPEQKKAGKPVPGPSAIAARGGKFRQLPGGPGYITPTAIEDPWTYVEEYRNAAKMAKLAGFDGVELHSANGYLIHQFLDYTSNQRTDQWGGSIENRCRLGLECLKVLVEVWGPARVGIKVNPCGGYNDMGMPIPDTMTTFTYYLTEISAMKVAYVQLVRYLPIMDIPIPVPPSARQMEDGRQYMRGVPHDVLAVYGPLIKPPPASLAQHAEEQLRGPAMPKPAFDARNPTPTRLFLNGGLSPEEVEGLLDQGLIDGAVFGTLWICNPDLQKRLEGGLAVNMKPDVKTFYAYQSDPREGYTTYPEAEGSKL